MNTNNHEPEFTLKPSDFLALLRKAMVLERLISNKLGEAVTEWLQEKLTASGIQQIVRRISKRALAKVCGPHMFRHTFASNFLLNGGQEFELQRLLGHSSLKIVQEYVQATQDIRALKAHQMFSPVDRLGLR